MFDTGSSMAWVFDKATCDDTCKSAAFYDSKNSTTAKNVEEKGAEKQ